MIWRDDDIGRDADVRSLTAVDDILQDRGLVHTVAIIADGLTRQPEIAALVRDLRMVPQLHCWQHDDLTEWPIARDDLGRAVQAIEGMTGRRPTVLYPPWNKTNAAVEAAASRLGLTVSARKVSIDQFIRCEGDVAEDTINFHYWHQPDRERLADAADIVVDRKGRMKKTDYCPRAAPFDTHLRGLGLRGAEIGVDAGAHAEALLRYCDIASLTLIDPWPKPYQYGLCEGRLQALGFGRRFHMVPKRSVIAAEQFDVESLDFVYIDQEHDGPSVTADLMAWWPKVKRGGVLGYRNYSTTATPLVQAVDVFVARYRDGLDVHVETGEIVLVKR